MNEFNEVKESINEAINEIEKHSPELAEHLRSNIKMDEKTQTFCYEKADEMV